MIEHTTVVVVGAGLAGITCARELQQRGVDVLIVEKSRGVGGRVATRRFQNTCIDHGLPFLQTQGSHTQKLIEQFGYYCSEGMTTIAKTLADNIPIWRNCRVTGVSVKGNNWLLELTGEGYTVIRCKVLVMAIPAPQAVALLLPIGNIPQDFLSPLLKVEFDPCIVVMAGYPKELQPEWLSLPIKNHPDVQLLTADSNKRKSPRECVIVFHSTPRLAKEYLDSDNLDIAKEKILGSTKLFQSPLWSVAHRWRYASTITPLGASYIATDKPLPLVCCGDWGLGNLVEDAIISGYDSAQLVFGTFVTF